ncbi:beta-Ig-H3/Fasciclin [Metarhizium guizhouense ARSEF 977]|uniref:Beta-Ig-H3/Fasciclin n=2 Tax=Metarhizium TaxID=5529 RepID=A0A0B4HS93_METGA|nr:beta-Ig-H3/Fasciclin [Metarhizium guizhouense ARSEF 977]
MWLQAALSLAAWVSAAVADDSKDLGSVLAANKNLTKFYELIKKYPDVLLELPSDNGVTIVAPSDKAMANIAYTALQPLWDADDKDKTTAILQYHVLDGAVSAAALRDGPTYLETSRLTSPALTNVVDNLLVPPAQLAGTADAFGARSFLGSLYAARLMPALAVRRDVTIFAPLDDAYGLVGGTLKGLNASRLARVMDYHVVPGRVLSSAHLANGTSYDTLATDAAGKLARVLVRQEGNSKFVNAAQIVQPDILLANGIMHIIGNVLNPDAERAAPDPSAGTQAPAFAVSTVSGVFTSDLPCTADCPATTTAATATGGADSSGATPTTTSSLFSSTSHGGGARCTAHVVGAAVGMVGLGAGVAWI